MFTEGQLFTVTPGSLDRSFTQTIWRVVAEEENNVWAVAEYGFNKDLHDRLKDGIVRGIAKDKFKMTLCPDEVLEKILNYKAYADDMKKEVDQWKSLCNQN